MTKVVGLPNNSYTKPITNTAWITKKGALDSQLLAHDRWFSPGTPASSTTKAGLRDIAEILLKVALSTNNQSIKLELHNSSSK